MGQAFITVITGVLVFVVGQIIVKLFIEPAHEQSKIIGEIYFALTYYSNIYVNPGRGKDEILEKTSDAFKKYGSQLKGATYAIRLYKLWESLGLVQIESNVKEAVGHLIRISNSIFLPAGQTEDKTEQGRSNKNDAAEIARLLKERKFFCKKTRSGK